MFSKYKREQIPLKKKKDISTGQFCGKLTDPELLSLNTFSLHSNLCLLTSFLSPRLTVPRVGRVEISLMMMQKKIIPLKCFKTKARSLFSKYDEYKVEMFVLKWREST